MRNLDAQIRSAERSLEKIVEAAAQLGLGTSGRGEVWSIYTDDHFAKLAAPEDLTEVLTWAAEEMAGIGDKERAKAFAALAEEASDHLEFLRGDDE